MASVKESRASNNPSEARMACASSVKLEIGLGPEILKNPKTAREKTNPRQRKMREKSCAMRFGNSCLRKPHQSRLLKNENHQASVSERKPRDEFVKSLVQSIRRHVIPSE